jgi:RimJ/RimL family protein N-acetyltransferase
VDRQPILEGERLRLRPLRAEDREALFAVASDRDIWARHPAHDRWQRPVFDAFFDEGMASGGAFAIIDRAIAGGPSGGVIGSSRYGMPEMGEPDEIEIGWSFLARSYWGGGYNAEFKRLMLGHALAHYRRVTFQVGADNVISRRAMANIGGVLLPGPGPVIERSGAMVEHVVFVITREGFAAGPLSRARPASA